MNQPSKFTRQKAMALMAGGAAVSAAPIVVAAQEILPTPSMDSHFSAVLQKSREHMLAMLTEIRHAIGDGGRKQAFQRFKTAFAMHDCTESLADDMTGYFARNPGEGRLYRVENPNYLLARVIVRELDTWPLHDTGWLRRFTDLERIVRDTASSRPAFG